jgi:hypothetical protein
VALTICFSIGLALLSLFVCRETAFAIVREITLDGLSLQSDAIVVGTVTNANSFWQDGQIYTDVTVSVEQTVKGDPSQTEITVRQPGGRVGDMWEWVEDAPGFAVGERAVLFLGRGEGPAFGVVGAFQGKFPVQNDKVFLEGRYVPLPTLLGRVTTILEGGEPAPLEPQPEPGLAPCTITSITPSAASAGTGSKVDIYGSNFDSAGWVEFYGPPPITPTPAPTPWNDTVIRNVVVPGNSDYGASSGTLNVHPKDNPSCPSTSPFLVTFSYNGNKWAGAHPIVPIHINPNNKSSDGIPPAAQRAAVWAAADTWNRQASFSFLLGVGDSSKVGIFKNSENGVSWVVINDPELPTWAHCNEGATLAGTYCWVWGAPGPTITECDFMFNDRCAWSTDGASGTYDVQSVAVHEFGHFLTLNDLYGDPDWAKIMYGVTHGKGTTHRTLHDDDIAGIRWIYSAVGGIAQLPDVASGSGSSTGTYAALAGGLAAAVLALAAGAWYARRRLS